MIMQNYNSKLKGIAALPTVLFLVLIISGLVLTIGFLFFYQSQGETAINQSRRALHYAEAGIYDALLKIDRDLTFESAGYTLNFNSNGEAEVSVQRDTPEEDKDTIYSLGKCGDSRRKIKVIIQIESNTGKVSILSWQEEEI